MGKEVENMSSDESDPHIHETKEELSNEGNEIITQEEEGPDGQELAGEETENGNGNTPQKGNVTKKAQGDAKPAQSDNSSRRLDEEDSSSIASSNAAKGKITVASGPIFKCSARAEKRREFYQKLEEKHQAMEAQKNQSEARAKKEQDAIMRQFRKSLTFKATPMPSFYQEGPPPKAELKKVPTTRAKSPKLGRRKSLSDASTNKNASESNQTKGRIGNHHSLDSSKESSAKGSNVVPKDRVNKPAPTRAHKVPSNERVVNIALQT